MARSVKRVSSGTAALIEIVETKVDGRKRAEVRPSQWRPRFDWKKIEVAYDHEVPRNVRPLIKEATEAFIRSWSLHCGRPTASNVIRIINRRRTLLNELRAEMSSGDDDAVYAQQLIAMQRLGHGSQQFNHQRALCSLLERDIEACDDAVRDLTSARAIRDGEYWDRWVYRLYDVLRTRGLPAGARKEHTRDDPEPPKSEFVRLIEHLEDYLPTSCRQVSDAAAGLTWHVSRALASERGS
jgi:hypothetical protein